MRVGGQGVHGDLAQACAPMLAALVCPELAGRFAGDLRAELSLLSISMTSTTIAIIFVGSYYRALLRKYR